jgi:hypothetical protein
MTSYLKQLEELINKPIWWKEEVSKYDPETTGVINAEGEAGLLINKNGHIILSNPKSFILMDAETDAIILEGKVSSLQGLNVLTFNRNFSINFSDLNLEFLPPVPGTFPILKVLTIPGPPTVDSGPDVATSISGYPPHAHTLLAVTSQSLFDQSRANELPKMISQIKKALGV